MSNHCSTSCASSQYARDINTEDFAFPSYISTSSSPSARTHLADSLFPLPSSISAQAFCASASTYATTPPNKHFQDMPSSVLQSNLLPFLRYNEILQLREISKTHFKDIEALFSALLEAQISCVRKEFQEDARRELYSNNSSHKNYSAAAKILRNLRQLEMVLQQSQIFDKPFSPSIASSAIFQLMKIRSSWEEATQQEIFKKLGKRSIEYFSSRIRTLRWAAQRASALNLKEKSLPSHNLSDAFLDRWPQLIEALFAKPKETIQGFSGKDPRREVLQDLAHILPAETTLPLFYAACSKIQSKAKQLIESSEREVVQRIEGSQDKVKMTKQMAALEKTNRLYETYLLRSLLLGLLPLHNSGETERVFFEAIGIPAQDFSLAAEKLFEWLHARIAHHPSAQTFFENFNTSLNGLSDTANSRDYISAIGQALITSWGLPWPLQFPAFNPPVLWQQILSELHAHATATSIWTLAPLLLERIQENKLEPLAPGCIKFLNLLSHIKYTRDEKFWDQSHGQEIPLWRAILPPGLFKNNLFPLLIKILDIPCSDRTLLESLEKNFSQENVEDLSSIFDTLRASIGGNGFQLSLALRTSGQLIFGLFPTLIKRLHEAQIAKQLPHLMELLQLLTTIQGTEQLCSFDNKQTIQSWEETLPKEIFQGRSLHQLLEIFDGLLKDPEISKIIEKLVKTKFQDLRGWSSIVHSLVNRISSLSFQLAHASELLRLKKFFKIEKIYDFFSRSQSDSSFLTILSIVLIYTSQAYKGSLTPFVREQTLSLQGHYSKFPLFLLPRMPPNFWKQLKIIDLRGQWDLRSLPREICSATNLQDLCLDGCENLETLPSGLAKLPNLRKVSINRCKKLDPKNIPEEFDTDKAPEALHALVERSSLLGSMNYNYRKYRGPLFVATCALLGTISGIALRRFSF